MYKTNDWNYEFLTEAFDCDKDMIAYVESKRYYDYYDDDDDWY